MDTEIDHYAVLGLPSGAPKKDIIKAYRSKALLTHPDKKPNDSNANAKCQQLNLSYATLLKEKEAREQAKLQRQTPQYSKRQSPVSDLEKREDEKRAKAEEDERIARTLQEEINRIRSQFSKKGHDDVPASKKSRTNGGAQSSNLGKGTTLDREKVLNVSWDKTGVDYGVQILKDMFSKFGIVEYVLMKRSKKKGSAIVVMATRDAAVAATRIVFGDISNPLLVLPLPPTQSTVFPSFPRATINVEPSDPNLSILGHQAFENSVLEKMKKAAK